MSFFRTRLQILLSSLAVCSLTTAYADFIAPSAVDMWDGYEIPWFTGPLLSPSAHVVTAGHINIQPYLFATTTFGIYNSHWNRSDTPDFVSINSITPIQIGLTEWMDIQIVPSMYWQYSEGASAIMQGDLPVILDFQLLKDSQDNYFPAIKLSIREIIPTGNYQRLNPNKMGADATGSGSWTTSVGLSFSRLFHIYKTHFLSARFNMNVVYFAPTFVHDFNVYGGGQGARGWIYPGLNYTALFGFEYNFSKHWALALDILSTWENRTKFSGNGGFIPTNNAVTHDTGIFPGLADALSATIGLPSSASISLAPAIEYMFNSSLGFITGAWFSIAGRNSGQFASGIFSLNYYY